MRTVLILFSVLIIVGCSNKELKENEAEKGVSYECEILHGYNELDTFSVNSLKSKDSLRVFFQGTYENDSISIFRNDSFIIGERITTIKRIGVAEVYNLGNIEGINKVSFSINGGAKLNLKINGSHWFLGVNYMRETPNVMQLVYYKNAPNFR